MTTRKRPLDEDASAHDLRQYSRDSKRTGKRDAKRPRKESTKSSKDPSSAASLRQYKNEVKKVRKPDPKPSLKECTICADELTMKNFPSESLHSNSHNDDVCTTCWQSHLATEIDSKSTSQVQCPQCPHILQEPDIKVLATAATYGTYLDKIFQETLQKDPDYRTCPSATCTYGYIMTQDDDQSDSIFNCRVCDAQYCVRCEVPMHKGQSCKDYKKERKEEKQKLKDEKASKKFLKGYATECPGCGALIRKSTGCDHMTCKRCKNQFCYRCAAPYSGDRGIYVIGNEAHARTCAYHPNRLPPGPEEDEDDG